MNWPPKDASLYQEDLRFEQELNPPDRWIISEDQLTATTIQGEYLETSVWVSSFDFGGYGKIKVTADVGGRSLVGYWSGDPQKT
jgi:hypothetical protein